MTLLSQPPPPVKPDCALLGGYLPHDGSCVYCGEPSRDARDRLAALIAALAPGTAPARRRLAALIQPRPGAVLISGTGPATNRTRP